MKDTIIIPHFINGTDGDDILEGTELLDAIEGYDGNDVLRGYAGNDMLRGGLGSDTLEGGTGKDTLFGDGTSPEGDNDVLTGGREDDTLYGGAGSDIFAFSAFDGYDVIVDFEPGTDKILLNVPNNAVDGSTATISFTDLKITYGLWTSIEVTYLIDDTSSPTSSVTNTIALIGIYSIIPTEADFVFV